MKKIEWTQPEFVKSATSIKDYPLMKNDKGDLLPEIAIAGRSNVGKSSLLNDLFRVKNLVRTSSTPGKTQLLNFFRLNRRICFVDLPGYGFAKVPLSVRKSWGPMIQEYLTKRNELQLLLFLFDIRRIPNAEDLQLMEWIAKAEKGVILILTKIDKVSSQELKNNTAAILKSFGVPDLHYVHYSVPKKIGRDTLAQHLQDAFDGEL